jgi:hypothetical protein
MPATRGEYLYECEVPRAEGHKVPAVLRAEMADERVQTRAGIPSLRLVGVPLARNPAARLRSRFVDVRYGLTLVPSHESRQTTKDLVAQRQRDGWQLVSSRVDSEGAEVLVFQRPA